MKKKVIVVGLGFGDETALPIGTLATLSQYNHIWLRTAKHPVVRWLQEKRIDFQTFDELYELSQDFSAVYQEITQRLIMFANTYGTVVYAVPGHPMVAEKTVQLLLMMARESGIEVDIRGGGSFLDILFARLGIDPIEGFALLDGTELRSELINPELHILIGQVYHRLVASDVKLTLMEVYPDDYEVFIVTAAGVTNEEKIIRLPLYELDRMDDPFTDLTSIYLPPVKQEEILYRRFDYLTQVIAYLRSPQGCPWDRKQTHTSLLPYLLEESYELIEAIHREDPEAILEELGDVLLQVLLHSQIADEEGLFDIYEVIKVLTEKMIRRHPHVFGEQRLETAEEVKASWEQIKQQERKEESQGRKSILDEISKGLPVLLYALEQHKKAAKVGFDWESKEQILMKVEEELAELRAAKTKVEQEDEIGDLFFILTSVARKYEINPEIALLRATQKFARRFRYIEEKARRLEKKIQEVEMSQLDAWWNEAKQREAKMKKHSTEAVDEKP